jgi:signal transduction histidine kinase
MWKKGLLVTICSVLLTCCRTGQNDVGPSIEFSSVPVVDEGGTAKIAVIEGRVIGSRPGQQIVLYARSGAWYVQPLTDKPFTKIHRDSTWKNSTHLGTEYAALLVEPGYDPPARTDDLPTAGGAVVTVAIVRGEARLLIPRFWEAWWFRPLGVLACIFAFLAFHRLKVRQLTHRLNVRFEERLEERMRIAQDLHDTLLQGFLSASMQLHVAAEGLPEDSQVCSQLSHIQQLMAKVIDEGQKTVQGLRSITEDSLDLEQAFSMVPKELAIPDQIGFRVTVEGRPRSLHPIIRDEVYRIGRQVLVNAFRKSRAGKIEVELKYSTKRLSVRVRDDGSGTDHQPHDKYSGTREQAEKIGARLRVRSHASTGLEVELSVPGKVAFLPNQKSAWY